MNRSLRWRLQGWYAIVLLTVVGGFATLLYAQMRSARVQEIDAALTADALHLDTNLRRFPAPMLEGGRRDDQPPPPPFDGPPDRPPPDRPFDRPRRDRPGPPPPNRE